MERFGADAGKTFSDQLKEPLTQMSEAIARSPVFRTGEVLVVHSVDIDLPKLKRTLFYLGAFITWMRFMHLFLGRWMFRGRSRYRRNMANVPTPPAITSVSQGERVKM